MTNIFLEKLKNKLSADRSHTHPIIIEDNFLVQTEIDDIKKKIFSLNYHWDYLGNTTNTITTRMLPAGMYSRTYDEYVKNISFRHVMEEQFLSYYTKIKNKIQDYFKLEAEYSSSLNYPGFHVFALNNANNGRYDYYNFHIDRFQYLNKFVSVGKIYSIVIPLTLPAQGGNLIYSFDNTVPKQHIDQNINYNTLLYKVGSMFMWEGNLVHSIEPFSLNNDENRITMQMHVNIYKDKISIFW